MDTPKAKSRAQPLPTLVNQFQEPEHVVSAASGLLSQHPQLRNYVGALEITFSQGHLHITGSLPSFYLKQMLQTALKGVSGIQHIINRVSVVASQNGVPRGDVTI